MLTTTTPVNITYFEICRACDEVGIQTDINLIRQHRRECNGSGKRMLLNPYLWQPVDFPTFPDGPGINPQPYVITCNTALCKENIAYV